MYTDPHWTAISRTSHFTSHFTHTCAPTHPGTTSLRASLTQAPPSVTCAAVCNKGTGKCSDALFHENGKNCKAGTADGTCQQGRCNPRGCTAPGDCGKHGSCVESACICKDGYTGLQCTVPPGACGTRVIVDGDTFWDLSIKLGFPLESILVLNPGVDPTKLQIGQVVNVPCMQPPPPPASVDCTNGCNVYCSKSLLAAFNATCEDAAAKLNIPAGLFTTLNPDLDCKAPSSGARWTPIVAGTTQLCVHGTVKPIDEDILDPRNPNRCKAARLGMGRPQTPLAAVPLVLARQALAFLTPGLFPSVFEPC